MTGKLPIVLFNPASCRPQNRRFPLSLYALIPLLRQAGFAPVLVDGNLSRQAVEDILEALGPGPSLLAMSVMPGPQLDAAHAAATAVRARAPLAKIVWGGYFPSMHTDVTLRSPLVDFAVKGRGEMAMLALATALANGEDGKRAAGVSTLGSHGKHHTAPALPVPHPDDLPQFDYTGVPITPYLNRTYLGARTVGQNTSYGCAWGCNFCAVTATYGRRYKALSPDIAAAGMHHLAKTYGVDSCEFFDNDFFIHEARTVELGEAMPRGWKWWAYGRADEMLKLKHASWVKLKASGMAMVYMGAESGSETVLKRMNKELALEEIREAARRFGAYGVKPEFSFVLGNPVDPETDIVETIEFIRDLRRVNPESEIVLYKYTPMPVAGEMFDGATDGGFAYPTTLDEWVTPRWIAFGTMTDPRTPWMTPRLKKLIDDFDCTLQALHPSPGVLHLSRPARAALKALASWRYKVGYYRHPLEIRAALRLARYAPLSKEGLPRA